MTHPFLSSKLLPGIPTLPGLLTGRKMLPSLSCPGSYLGDQSLVLRHELIQVFLVLIDAFQQVGALVLQLVQLLVHLWKHPGGLAGSHIP